MRPYGMNETKRFDVEVNGGPPSRRWANGNHSKSKRRQRRTLHKRARRAAKLEIRKETACV